MKKSLAETIKELRDKALYTKNLEKILKDLSNISEEGIKSMKVDKLSDEEVVALNYMGYTVEYHENDEELIGGDYYIVNGMF